MWPNTWNSERLERQTMRCLDRGFKILNFPLADITFVNEYLYNSAIHGRKHFVVTAVIGVHQNIATENLSGTHHTYQHLKSRLF